MIFCGGFVVKRGKRHSMSRESYFLILAAFLVVTQVSCRTTAVQNIKHSLDENGNPQIQELDILGELPSPDGKWVLTTDIYETEDGVWQQVYLGKGPASKNTRGEPKEIFTYRRTLEAIWSPDSKYLCVNWSNYPHEHNCDILRPIESGETISLPPMIYALLSRDKWYAVGKTMDCEVQGVKWNKNCSLDLIACGDLSNEEGNKRIGRYCFYLRYTIGEGFTKLGKKVEIDPIENKDNQPTSINPTSVSQRATGLSSEDQDEKSRTEDKNEAISSNKENPVNNVMDEDSQTKDMCAVPLSQNVDLGGGVKIEFVEVPAGSFMMGGNRALEFPPHQVTFSKKFILGKYEITQAQWHAVMGSNPSHYYENTERPVENVSWEDCQEFIQKLNSLGQAKFRLPSEAEWEYACQARNTGSYCFGDDTSKLGDYAWYRKSSTYATTFPVGQKQPNAWGLYDMHGNVSEWCQDGCHRVYDKAPADGRAWENPADKKRAVRGGSWVDDDWSCRSACRAFTYRDYHDDNTGFRLVWVP
jgi:formylglycine-generating enzyme required for sulfatase activity